MKTSKTLYHAMAMAIVLFLGLLPRNSHAQIYLTGLLQDGTGPNGETAGSPIWNTLGNELSYANLYVTQPNAGYNAPFINSGKSSPQYRSILKGPPDCRFRVLDCFSLEKASPKA